VESVAQLKADAAVAAVPRYRVEFGRIVLAAQRQVADPRGAGRPRAAGTLPLGLRRKPGLKAVELAVQPFDELLAVVPLDLLPRAGVAPELTRVRPHHGLPQRLRYRRLA